MPDAVAATALGVALFAIIIGVSFYRRDIWLALNEKTSHGPSVNGPIGLPDASGGPSCSGGDAGSGGGSA